MKFTINLTSIYTEIPENLKNFLSELVKISIDDDFLDDDFLDDDDKRRSWNGLFEIDLSSIGQLLKIVDINTLIIRKQYDFGDKDLIKSHPYHIEIYNDYRE